MERARRRLAGPKNERERGHGFNVVLDVDTVEVKKHEAGAVVGFNYGELPFLFFVLLGAA
jgi:hypothetical protein